MVDPINEESLERLGPELRIGEKEEKTHRLDGLILLLFTCLLTLTVLTVWLFKHRRIRFLHETGLALIYGLVIGAILRYGVSDFGVLESLRVIPYSHSDVQNVSKKGIPDILFLMGGALSSASAKSQLMEKTLAYSFKGEVRDVDNIIDQKTTFDPELFFNVLLPPIIFHAGYSMKKRFFFRNIGSILVFAFVGTTISTFTVAGLMYGVTRLSSTLSEMFKFVDTLRFGALISATDPVTILAIFSDMNVDVNLYALVFGESVLNDAVAIVITRTLEDYELDAKLNPGNLDHGYIVFLKSLGEFIGIFGASFLVGSLIGCATAMITKFTHIRNFPQLESTLFVLMSYSSFLIAEVLHLTGIVAVLFCGICQAHYTYNNLSPESRDITKQFFGLLNFMAENFIFTYVGVSMFTFPKHNFNPIFIFGSFLSIVIGRAVNIYPLSFLLNLGRKNKISLPLQHMLFLSGLRGAIAFALSINNTLVDSRQMILSTTLLIVVITVIVCGGSTMSLLTWLGIPLGSDPQENTPLDYKSGPASPLQHQYNSVVDESESGGASNPSPPLSPNKSAMAKMWSGVDVKFFKPLLTHSNPTLMETMPECCLPLAKVLTSTEQLSRHPAMVGGGVLSDDDVIAGSPSASGDPEAQQSSRDSLSDVRQKLESPPNGASSELPPHI